ncbi:hypothetical protein OIU84_025319 [Salix udensis]|uniref:Uncharacterized protein n=1 Tax=Salix udensis TaxID=889485 RepID=A0AAD6KJB4_9ROSI|nr:hypothetical protein OIU84_025319 [Salix udensis]
MISVLFLTPNTEACILQSTPDSKTYIAGIKIGKKEEGTTSIRGFGTSSGVVLELSAETQVLSGPVPPRFEDKENVSEATQQHLLHSRYTSQTGPKGRKRRESSLFFLDIREKWAGRRRENENETAEVELSKKRLLGKTHLVWRGSNGQKSLVL